ncbi:conjugative transfer relaxase/helicase TraI [Pantoea sp. At-9b]|uniref:conjugative transfer relaxase/helicase TraI n=1 Tax=Pantoea sp. (strain At-9b) TaxID=592316 RepID=UPI0001B3E8C6|nr:conjugative transfer relaxase/helicase TraI [Pantoea sp. At-9b]ADU72059.1 conjugative transfer relaxase protein TraI [Pantoea sp. At-9b]
MMTIAPVASAADAAGYYSSQDNYYFLDDLQSQWLGEGARELGLEGPVDLDTLTAVLHGKLPNGVELGKDVQGSHVHRPGHDLTFSAPKSISMLILAGGDKRLLAAHHEAVKETLALVEQMVSARDTRDGVTRITATGKMVAALFTHDTSRNLDPQIHTHAVLANVTELDGKWKALATDTIHGAGFIETLYRYQVSFGKLYRTALKGKTEALGYETELTGGKHELWEVKGFTGDVLEEFSSRHREISARVGEEASLKSRDVAALDTRRPKQDISRLDDGQPVPQGEQPVTSPAGDNRSPDTVPPGRAVPPQTLSRSDAPEQGKPDAADGREVARTAEPENTLSEAPGTEPEAPQPGEHPPGRDSMNEQAGPDQESPIEKPETPDGRARLKARWQRQMDSVDFDIEGVMREARERVATREEPGAETPLPGDVPEAVRTAISVLSDSRTRFTYGDLLLTAHQAGEQQHSIPDLRRALDRAISDNLLAPLDGDKGVFTSHIHLLDELSVQSLAADIIKENRVVSFRGSPGMTPEHLKQAARAPVAILNAPASVQRLRDTVEELVTMSRENGREVSVLASGAERALTLSKSALLKDTLLQRSRVTEKTFSLAPQSTLIIEGAEKLGLKEMLVLTGEAREKNAQLLFLDSAGRQSNTNALSVLASAGVERLSLTAPAPGLEARVFSIQDKRDRYRALAERFTDLSVPDSPVTAAVTGAREQQQLTGYIRDALQNAGKLGRDTVEVEARTPVFITAKERKLPVSYRPGMVLEDRSDRQATRHFVIDRVHDDTRMLSLIDGDGVLSRVKLSALTADWRLFTREQLSIAQGEQLFALAADRSAGLKARDRLTVTALEDGALTVMREGQQKALRIATDRPLYVTHGYVSAPGARDNERGTVLASLSSRELSANMMNALAQSGSEAEIFTGEALNRAEEKLMRLRTGRSPVALVRQASGREDVNDALETLNANLLTDAEKAVSRAVAQMRHVSFSEVKLLEEAEDFLENVPALRTEIARQVKAGGLMPVMVGGESRFVSRATWEMEKAIVGEIAAGKNAVEPLMATLAPSLLTGLTAGQQAATTLILQSPDRFTAVQGYAGTGKTTQFKAVRAAIETLPEGARPLIIGLAPTHRAVKEMRDTGIEAQTLKSFVLDWQQRTAAGEEVRYGNTLFLIDESSMLGNQDTAAAYRAIAAGDGRAVQVGDVAQLESPESGAPFRLMQERSPIDVAVMKEIVRQRDANLKSAVYSVIENKAAAALEKINRVSPGTVPREAGEVVPSRSVTETGSPVRNIVADYIGRTKEAREQTMIVVQLHEDRRAINEAIHIRMVQRKELGGNAVTVPVLDRITGGRHDFNRIRDWKAGQVVLANERYLTVTGVDEGTDHVLLRDESGRMQYYSPAELNATEIEVFERREIELREGDSVRLNKTQKQAGHAAHEQYRVAALRDNGEIVLQNREGEKVIDPKAVTADRHVDYAWAVTGYGAQGASTDYVIALEGTEGARANMSGMRAFYISASRAKAHVQIYTDGLKDWMGTLQGRESGPATAHDALSPEPERAQARSIWAMGQPLSKTAIGRAFLRGQGLKGAPLTARIIPPTKKYPDAHLALPVYDGNGKTAGLTLVPLTAEAGQPQPGEVRQLITGGAQAAIVQKSRNGETVIVSDLQQALAAARDKPQAGVLLLTGRHPPSAQLLKVAGGQPGRGWRPDATLLRLVQAELQEGLRDLPPDAPVPDERAALRAALDALEKGQEVGQNVPSAPGRDSAQENSRDLRAIGQLLTEGAIASLTTVPVVTERDRAQLSALLAMRVVEAMRQQLPFLPGEPVPDYAALVRQASAALAAEAGGPDSVAVRAVLDTLSGVTLPQEPGISATAGQSDSIPAGVLKQVQEALARDRVQPGAPQQQALSESTLAGVARELERRPELPSDTRGREPEREELTRESVRHIQKER